MHNMVFGVSTVYNRSNLYIVLKKVAAVIVNIQYTDTETSNKSPCTFIKRKKMKEKSEHI